MNEQQEISAEEIDARILSLINQRNKALDENVLLSSRVMILEKQLKTLQAFIDTSKKADVIPIDRKDG